MVPLTIADPNGSERHVLNNEWKGGGEMRLTESNWGSGDTGEYRDEILRHSQQIKVVGFRRRMMVFLDRKSSNKQNQVFQKMYLGGAILRLIY